MEKLRQALGVAALAAIAVLLIWQTQAITSHTDQIETMRQTPQPVSVVEEQVAQLPEDGGLYHISVIVNDDWTMRPVDKRLVGLWAREWRPVSLKSQVAYHFYTRSDPTYQANLAHAIPDVPAVVVQDASGQVRYKASGAGVVGDGPIRGVLNRLCPNCPKPGPEPAPEPEPSPEPGPEPVVIPDTPAPQPEPKPADDFPWAVLIGAVVAAGVGSLVFQFRRELAGK